MEHELFFKKMYHDIWQGNHLDHFDVYYSHDFHETITTSDKNKQPIFIEMNYEQLKKAAYDYAKKFKNIGLTIQKIVSNKDHICVNFHTTLIDRNTNELLHRCASGIWHLNKEFQIDHVWAVVTPYYDSYFE